MKYLLILLLVAGIAVAKPSEPTFAIAYFDDNFIWTCIPINDTELKCVKNNIDDFKDCLMLSPDLDFECEEAI